MYKSIMYAGRKWMWPEHDTKLLQVNDWVRDSDQAIELCGQRRTAVQAGGACGIWPAYLANRFTTVVTFEPDPINFRCLVENNVQHENVIAINAALGSRQGLCALKNPPSEDGNAGTWYPTEDDEGRTPVVRLDDVVFDQPVDLLALDVEGYEIYALQGALKTITRWKPVIMLEDKPLPQMDEIGTKQGDSVEWLIKNLGYEQKSTVHRDVILVPCK